MDTDNSMGKAWDGGGVWVEGDKKGDNGGYLNYCQQFFF